MAEPTPRRYSRPRATEARLDVDFAAVMAQAVENERWRVLREVRRAVEPMRTMKQDPRSYLEYNIEAATFKRDVLDALNRIEEADHG